MDKFYKDVEIVEQMCLNDVSHDVIVNTINILKLDKYYTVDDLKSTEGILSRIVHSMKAKRQEKKINELSKDKTIHNLISEIKEGLSKIQNLMSDDTFVNKMRSHMFNFNYNLFIDYENTMKLFHDLLDKYKNLLSLLNNASGEKEEKIYEMNKTIYIFTINSLKTKNIKNVVLDENRGIITSVTKPNLKTQEKSYAEWFSIVSSFISTKYSDWKKLSDVYYSFTYQDECYDAINKYARNVLNVPINVVSTPELSNLIEKIDDLVSFNMVYDIQKEIENIIRKVLTKFAVFVHQSLAFAKK